MFEEIYNAISYRDIDDCLEHMKTIIESMQVISCNFSTLHMNNKDLRNLALDGLIKFFEEQKTE